MLKYSQHAPSKISDTDGMWSKFTLIKNNSVSDYMGQFSQRQEVKGETGGWGVRSNRHPPPSNTVRCFPSSGSLHFRQDDQFSGCLLMWKYTVYICVCQHVCSVHLRMHARLFFCVCITVRVDNTQGDGAACARRPLCGLNDLPCM